MTHGRRRSGRALAAGLLGLALASAPTGAGAAPPEAEQALGSLQRAQESLAQPRTEAAPVGAAAVVGPSLERGQALAPGDALRSPSRRWLLENDADGLVLTVRTQNRLNPSPYDDQVVLIGEAGSRLVLQDDGNLVLYGADGSVQDDTGTQGSGATSLRMQDDGNVVLYGADDEVVLDFETNVVSELGPGGTLLPGEQLTSADLGTRLVMQGDGNLVLYTRGAARFASGTRTPGSAAVYQEDGNLVVYGPDGRALWSSGTAGSGPGLLALTDREFRIFTVQNEDFAVAFGSEWGSSTVEPGLALLPGDRRTAPGGVQLVLQADGNLVEYVRGRAVFSIGPSPSTTRLALMQPDGNFVVYQTGVGNDAAELTPVFNTRTAGNPGSRLVVQGDANVVVYSPANRALFATRR